MQSVSRPVKCFAFQVCNSFRRKRRICIYSLNRITSVKNNQLFFEPNIKMFMAANEFIICFVCLHFLLEKCLTRLGTAVKFDRQAGYRLPNHSLITCFMLSDFHSDGGACSTGNVIGSWQRFFSLATKTVVVKTARKRLGNRSDKIKNLC